MDGSFLLADDSFACKGCIVIVMLMLNFSHAFHYLVSHSVIDSWEVVRRMENYEEKVGTRLFQK